MDFRSSGVYGGFESGEVGAHDKLVSRGGLWRHWDAGYYHERKDDPHSVAGSVKRVLAHMVGR